MQQRPFSLFSDPDFLFLGDKRRAVLATAELAVLNRCLPLVSAPGDDARVPPVALPGPQAVVSVARQPGLAGDKTLREHGKMQRIEELKRQAERLARERCAAAEQLGAERRAGE